jgi:two-component system OmpR family response regulator
MDQDNHAQDGVPAFVTVPSQKGSPSRILLVDDDRDIRELFTKVLMYSGYEVDAAADGADAWNILQNKTYDLLITDNEMPNLTGIELLKKILSARIIIPVIMATGKPPQEEFDRCPQLRPSATLLKPYKIEDLLQKVQEVLLL